VCLGSGGDANATAFIWTTALLSFLPLAMIGGAIHWLFSRAGSMALDDEWAEAPEPVAAVRAFRAGRDTEGRDTEGRESEDLEVETIASAAPAHP
jgi:hypothetical protein